MNNNTQNLKSLTELTQEEKTALAQKEWQNKNMQDYLIKTYDFYKTQDEYIIEIEKANKLSITKELYYDDEYDAPQINFNNFLWENRQAFNKLNYIKEHTKASNDYLYLIKQNSNIADIMDFTSWEIKDDKFNYFSKKIAIRPLTEEEKEDYINILENRNNQFKIRLEKYFNKYKDKITAHGYWANR